MLRITRYGNFFVDGVTNTYRADTDTRRLGEETHTSQTHSTRLVQATTYRPLSLITSVSHHRLKTTQILGPRIEYLREHLIVIPERLELKRIARGIDDEHRRV